MAENREYRTMLGVFKGTKLPLSRMESDLQAQEFALKKYANLEQKKNNKE